MNVYKSIENAYKIADYIETTDCEYIDYNSVALMLRNQAKHIAILEAKLKHYGPAENEGDFITTSRKDLLDYIEWLREANTKMLEDDEIIQIACNEFYGIIKKEEKSSFIKFAKEILKKAQEK